MATRSNLVLAEGEAERGMVGERWQCDTSYSTKVVRDITYKIIPFCSLCLVIFSVGAIIVSTLAFNKPVPRQGTIVISGILLSFFVLFVSGFMYLYFRRFRPHISKPRDPTDSSLQASHSDRHLGEQFRNTARRFDDPSATIISNTGTASHARPRGAQGDIIRSDVLRDPAPSPNTYRNRGDGQPDIGQGNTLVYELAGSIQQQGLHAARQHERQTGETNRTGPSNPVRGGDLEAYRLRDGGKQNRSVPASMASKIYVRQTPLQSDTRDIQKHSLESPLVGDLGRSGTGLRKYMGTPIPTQNNIPRRPQYLQGQEILSQVPTINLQTYDPSPLSSPGSARTGPQQFPSPFLDTTIRKEAARPQVASGKQRERDDSVNASPWPLGKSTRTGTQNKREYLRPVVKFFGESDNYFPGTLIKRPIGPRPMDGGLHISVRASPDGKLPAGNTATARNKGHSPSTRGQAGPELRYQFTNDKQLRRKSIPFNIANSLNGIHPDVSNRDPALPPRAFPASPMPNQIHPVYLAAAPLPLTLPTKDQYYVPRAHTTYNWRKIKPQPRPVSHEPPIYEVEEERDEAPRISVLALDRGRIQRLRGGSQRRIRLPRGGSSRKFKKKTLNASRGLGTRLKEKK